MQKKKTRGRGASARPRKLVSLSSTRIPPRLQQEALARERLFQLLDRQAHRALTWISGPPGSGKTTLVASYLERSGTRVLWYRADGSDIDFSTVFHNLREAAVRSAPRAAGCLPALTPEYLLDVPTFARNFLRRLFKLLKAPAAIVFDNVHDAAEGALDRILEVAAAEVPEGIQLFAISRSLPPTSITALELKGMLAMIEWEDLRLTVEEATDIALRAGVHDRAAILSQHALSDGWVAGFVLLLEHFKRRRSDDTELAAHTRSALFNYFSSELLSTVPESTRRLLLSTALLPSFTLQQAAAFGAREQAEEIVAWLAKRNFFIESRAGSPATFRYHDLFREFLLERGRESFPPAEHRALIVQAAQCAEAAGQLETALKLWTGIEDWKEALRLICLLAPQTLAQGRGMSVVRWLQAVPADALGRTPWALYWQGLALLMADPRQGREILERAYSLFSAAGLTVARLLTCCHIIQSFFLEWGDQHPQDPWLDTFRALMERSDLQLPLEVEAQILPLFVGVILRYAHDPIEQTLIRRAEHLLDRSLDAEHMVPLACYLSMQYEVLGRWRDGSALLARLERVGESNMTPVMRLWHFGLKIIWSAMHADAASEAGGREQIRRALEFAASTGIQTLNVFLLSQGVYFALIWRDLALAEDLLQRMRLSLVPQRIMDLAHFEWCRAAVALEAGAIDAAAEHMHESMKNAVACGTHLGLCQNRVLLAQIQEAQGDAAAALETIGLALDYARRAGAVALIHAGLLVKAFILLRSGDHARGLAELGAGLTLGRTTGQSVIAPAARSAVTSFLYSEALRNRLEVDYVRKLIKVYDLRPVVATAQDWPWPLRIYTLGRFSLVRDGVSVKMSGKTQKKPLHLLMALIALGGRSVRLDALMRQVWTNGSYSRPNLDVALVRLRRLLGRADALILSGGTLTLDERLCWVDCWAFERLMNAADDGRQATALREAVGLYSGPFLGGDSELPCISKARDRMAAKFQRATLKLGHESERDGHFAAAAQIYRRALEDDNLVEEFYQRLMYCEWRLGNRAEAIRTYRRCRALLADHMKTPPSASTEALCRQILGG